MSSAQELAQLRDIHLPQVIGWWPLAPGWYVLSGLLTLGIGFVIFFLWRRYLQGKAKRQALKLLANYQQQYEHVANAQLVSARISELLKRVALAYFPRETVAGLQGNAWIEFLNSTSTGMDFKQVTFELLELPYRQTTKPQDLTLCFNMAKRWINQRKRKYV